MTSGWANRGDRVRAAIANGARTTLACAAAAAVAATAACTEIPPSGRPFEPVHPARSAQAPRPTLGGPTRALPAPAGSPGQPSPSSSQSSPGADPGGFDFEAEDRAPTGSAGSPTDTDPIALQEKLLGLAPGSVARGGDDDPGLVVEGPHPRLPPAPVFDPNAQLPDVSFGVRVLGVVTDLSPPRAMLALPDGREIVVTPGAMVPDQGLVVLAIARNAVQIAHVTPNGFLARVTTETVAVLAPPSAALPVQ